MYLWIKNLYL